MIYYEMKKVFSKKSSRLSLIVLAALLILVLYFQVSGTEWVNENGDTEKGFTAIRKMREVKREWSGVLDTDKISRVIQENNRINATPEAKSDKVREQDVAFGRKQGFYDIRQLLNYSFGGFQDYDYYTADSLLPEAASEFYPNRIKNLENWFMEEGGTADILTEPEKAFLLERYGKAEEPFLYDYQDGWRNLFRWTPTIIMITTMVLGFLCAGIFADEFRLKASAVFFSSYHGRGRAVMAKLKAGFLIVTVIYWGMMLLYSAFTLGIFGTDGAGCVIQSTADGWKSFYNITNAQEYFLIMFGGYVGCLFMVILAMFASAVTKSSLLAVIVPFALIFLPSFLGGFHSPAVSKITGVLPDQLLQMNMVIKYFNLYKVGNRVFGAVPVLMVVYSILSLVLVPVIYEVYKKKQVQ